jgi:hypothetical protein
MPLWDPPVWRNTASPERVLELVVWERDTLQPKHGITSGVEYTHTMGVAELYDYEWYFGGFLRTVRTPQTARMLDVEIGRQVVYFPRRSFDMWNTRYFVLPVYPNGWTDEFRGYASFLLESEAIYPSPATFRGPGGKERFKEWTENHDFQVFRNLNDSPRAWVVHNARVLRPVSGLSKEDRKDAMQEITYDDDPLWHDSTLRAFDPLTLAWVDSDRLGELAGFLPGGAPRRTETVKVTYPNPQQAELEATLESPGLVVLADVFYPGWELTIDGKPAPIYRVNRVMRGAAVPAGRHRLVYTYAPWSFQIGWLVSMLGLGAMALLAVVCTLRPVDPVIGGRVEPDVPESVSYE